MSGLASIQAQLGRHRNAYLAAAAGAVVLLALRNRKKSTAAAAAVPAAVTSGNPQFSAGAAQLDTSSLTSQLWDIQSSLSGLAASTTPANTVPSPATQAGGGMVGALPISAPLGGGTTLTPVTPVQSPTYNPATDPNRRADGTYTFLAPGIDLSTWSPADRDAVLRGRPAPPS